MRMDVRVSERVFHALHWPVLERRFWSHSRFLQNLYACMAVHIFGVEKF